MTPDPEFLTIDDVMNVHAMQLSRFGGGEGVRDKGLLESAVAAPRASFDGHLLHSDLFEIAAAYAFHIAQNQPFSDGNKRTGLLCAVVFLDINGIPIDYPDLRLSQAMIDIAEKKLDKHGLANLIREVFHRDG